jgi:hypothetical protein
VVWKKKGRYKMSKCQGWFVESYKREVLKVGFGSRWEYGFRKSVVMEGQSQTLAMVWKEHQWLLNERLFISRVWSKALTYVWSSVRACSEMALPAWLPAEDDNELRDDEGDKARRGSDDSVKVERLAGLKLKASGSWKYEWELDSMVGVKGDEGVDEPAFSTSAKRQAWEQ